MFISKIEFHKDLKVFSCPKCGTAPTYIVADGKSDGPTKRKVEHLKEFGPAENDTDCLSQGSKYKDRLFLPAYDERQSLCNLLSGSFVYYSFQFYVYVFVLLSGSTCVLDFLAEAEMETDNGRMKEKEGQRIKHFGNRVGGILVGGVGTDLGLHHGGAQQWAAGKTGCGLHEGGARQGAAGKTDRGLH